MDNWSYIGKPSKLFFFKNFTTGEIGFIDCEDQVDAFINKEEARKWVIDHKELITLFISTQWIEGDDCDQNDIDVLVRIKNVRPGLFDNPLITIEELIWLLDEGYMSSRQVVLRSPLNKLIPIFKHRIFEAAKNL